VWGYESWSTGSRLRRIELPIDKSCSSCEGGTRKPLDVTLGVKKVIHHKNTWYILFNSGELFWCLTSDIDQRLWKSNQEYLIDFDVGENYLIAIQSLIIFYCTIIKISLFNIF
jgi:hypothetical protein